MQFITTVFFYHNNKRVINVLTLLNIPYKSYYQLKKITMSNYIPFTRNRFFLYFNTRRKQYLDFIQGHVIKLEERKADSDILNMLNNTRPEVDTYKLLQETLGSAGSGAKGETARWGDLVDTIPNKLHLYDLQIQLKYPKKTPEYISIFPRGYSDIYYHQTYEQIIKNFGAFIQNIEKYPDLATVFTEAKTFYDLMVLTRKNQQLKGEGKTNVSDQLNEAFALLCQTLWGNLGLLMYKFRATPERVGDYFDFGMMQRKARPGEGEPETDTGDLFASITDAEGKPLLNVHTQLSGVEEAQLSDENGEVSFYELIPGTFTATFTLAGYKTITREAVITAGEETEVAVVMEKEV